MNLRKKKLKLALAVDFSPTEAGSLYQLQPKTIQVGLKHYECYFAKIKVVLSAKPLNFQYMLRNLGYDLLPSER